MTVKQEAESQDTERNGTRQMKYFQKENQCLDPISLHSGLRAGDWCQPRPACNEASKDATCSAGALCTQGCSKTWLLCF